MSDNRNPLRVAYVGPALYPTGYGQATRAHMKALQKAGAVVMGQLNERPTPVLADELVRDDHAVNEILDPKFWPPEQERGPDTWVWHVTPDAFARSGDGKPNLGYAVWEVEGLPEGWADACNRMDGLMTCSEFSARLFREGGVTVPIEVVPHPVDPERFNPDVDAGLRGMFPGVETLFVIVAQWMFRKGIEDALIAYASEFRPDEPVGMVLLTWRGGHSVKEKRAIHRYIHMVLKSLNVLTPRVWRIGDKLPDSSLPSLYAASDVLVLPSRGEAFSLPVFEAAACGRPSIVTGYGGMWDWLTDESAYRVAYDMETVHAAGPMWRHYSARQKWARPRLDDIRRAMREAHEDRGGRRRKGMAAFETVAENLSPHAVGVKMAEAIGRFASR